MPLFAGSTLYNLSLAQLRKQIYDITYRVNTLGVFPGGGKVCYITPVLSPSLATQLYRTTQKSNFAA